MIIPRIREAALEKGRIGKSAGIYHTCATLNFVLALGNRIRLAVMIVLG